MGRGVPRRPWARRWSARPFCGGLRGGERIRACFVSFVLLILRYWVMQEGWVFGFASVLL